MEVLQSSIVTRQLIKTNMICVEDVAQMQNMRDRSYAIITKAQKELLMATSGSVLNVMTLHVQLTDMKPKGMPNSLQYMTHISCVTYNLI